jgi:hypothetical protein
LRAAETSRRSRSGQRRMWLSTGFSQAGRFWAAAC